MAGTSSKMNGPFRLSERRADALEFAYEIEHGARSTQSQTHLPLHERNPARIWQIATFALAMIALLLAARLAGGRLR